MKIQELNIENFRGLKRVDLRCNGKSIILFGKNGAGKSTILDGIATILARYIKTINKNKNNRSIKDDDITHRAIKSKISVSISTNDFDDDLITWGITKTRNTNQRVINKEVVDAVGHSVVEIINSNIEHDTNVGIPIAVYYPVNRTVLDIPLRIRTEHIFDQEAAFDHALTSGANFRTFFEWFRNKEDLENETKSRIDTNYIDNQLQAVRTAIERFMPGFSDLKVVRRPLRMVIQKGEKRLEVNQLSDGEKCLLALVGDLARRLALANPCLENPLDGNGIVLIDELDLHLHPGWQRLVISGLNDVFPNIQFFISTHSPQILSELQSMKIFLLSTEGDENVVMELRSIYGKDTNRVLEDVMGVPARNQYIKDKLNELFDAIHNKEWEIAEQLSTELTQNIGHDTPELLKAEMLMRRKRG